jgi:hypothetical protein
MLRIEFDAARRGRRLMPVSGSSQRKAQQKRYSSMNFPATSRIDGKRLNFKWNIIFLLTALKSWY